MNIKTQFAQRKGFINSYHWDITDLKLEYYLSLWLQWLDKVQLSFQTVMCIAFPVLCVHVETTPNIQIYNILSPSVTGHGLHRLGLKSIEVKLKSNEAKPSWTST